MSEILNVKNISKEYGKKKVINNFNLKMYPGEILGLLGPNGAGKTTIIKMILGLTSITSGEIFINGYSIANDFEKAIREVGGIVETPQMYNYMSGFNNLRYYGRIRGVDDKNRINEVVSLIGMTKRIYDKVGKYSLGMKQRLGLGQALLHRPKLLILDEPTNGLDPNGIIEIRNLLSSLAEKNICILISSHLLNEIELLCDRVTLISKGEQIVTMNLKDKKEALSLYDIKSDDIEGISRILKDNSFGEIYESTSEKITILMNETQFSKLEKAVADKKINIQSIEKESKSLEKIYLRNIGDSNEIE